MVERLIGILQRARILHGLVVVLRKLGLLNVAFRVYEKLQAAGALNRGNKKLQERTDDVPIPPLDLIVLVAGTPSVEWFLDLGKSMFETIRETLTRNGVPPESMKAVLDFGCGCGRVLRYWRDVQGPRVYGTDYNPRLVTWCQKNLPFARVGTNSTAPPLSYEDGAFDCIYAISVFTHLSEELGREWMNELRRVLRPGGHLFFTTHGASYRETLKGKELAAFDEGRLVIQYEEASGLNLCRTFHPEAYVRNRLADGFTVCDVIAAGSVGAIYQDIYLFRKN